MGSQCGNSAAIVNWRHVLMPVNQLTAPGTSSGKQRQVCVVVVNPRARNAESLNNITGCDNQWLFPQWN